MSFSPIFDRPEDPAGDEVALDSWNRSHLGTAMDKGRRNWIRTCDDDRLNCQIWRCEGARDYLAIMWICWPSGRLARSVPEKQQNSETGVTRRGLAPALAGFGVESTGRAKRVRDGSTQNTVSLGLFRGRAETRDPVGPDLNGARFRRRKSQPH